VAAVIGGCVATKAGDNDTYALQEIRISFGDDWDWG